MCSKHVEAWNKLIVKQKFCVSSWLIIEINVDFYSKNKIEKLVHLLVLLYEYRSNVVMVHVTKANRRSAIVPPINLTSVP